MESLGTFYEDERRTDSRELRFGLNWRSTAMPMFEFSVFWLEVTEELCALRSPIRDVVSDGPVSRFIVGIPPHTNPQKLRDEEVTVEVLANLTEKESSIVSADGRRTTPIPMVSTGSAGSLPHDPCPC